MRRLSLVLMVLCLGVLSASAQQQPLPFPTDPDAIPPIGAAPSTALAFPSDEIAPYETPPIVPDFSTLPRFTLLVNSPADGEDVTIDGVCLAASGFCTLRAAIAEANSITSSTILLPLNSYTLTLGQLPTITGSVYIVGQPVNTNQLEPFPVISGNNTSRIFEIASSGFLGVQGVTLIDGFANDGNGGCVLVQGGGLLSMEYSSLRSCSADLTGGAVSLGNFASANFKNVSFMDNGALGVSAVGSPFDGSGASLTLTNVSVTGGVSSNGTAAVNITNGWLTMNNVTISTNQASTSASGLAVHPRNASAVNLSHVTITNNTGTQVAAGGGLLRYGGDFGLNLVNSVIAGNTYVGDPTRDDCIDTSGVNQTFVSAQHSVVGVLGGCTTFISTQFTSGVSVPFLPLAGYFTRNRTFTHAITPDSILFDNA
ncbi:MAG: hypothetical protein MUC99_01110, partial [Anaerolineae bacterium]|nr:hypothetical protein [Anaerolineae bacterium]